MQKDRVKVKLLKKEKIAYHTWKFTFEKPFSFIPGQYITMFLGNDTRDFTIASSPLEKDFFVITKEGVSEFKQTLFSLPETSPILVKLPAGGFTITNKNEEYVFLAGGIGMNPFYSMITYFHKKGIYFPITLLVSFSKKEDVIFLDKLKKIEKENDLFKFICSLSTETPGRKVVEYKDFLSGSSRSKKKLSHHERNFGSQKKWILDQVGDDKFEVGRITKDLIIKYVADFKKKKYLIAGSEQMVEDTQQILLDMGVDESNIRIDIFTGY